MAKQTAAPPFPFQLDPPETVECLEGFAGDGEVIMRQGGMLRADHPIVRRWPEKFIRLGSSDSEKFAQLQRIHPLLEPTQHVQLIKPTPVLLDEDAMICVKTIRGPHRDGDVHLVNPVMLEVGTRVHKNDPVVKGWRDHFVPVVTPGRTRENSVRALSPFTETRKDEGGNVIRETDDVLRMQFGEFKRFPRWFAGQWVDRELPEIRQYPQAFEGIY